MAYYDDYDFHYLPFNDDEVREELRNSVIAIDMEGQYPFTHDSIWELIALHDLPVVQPAIPPWWFAKNNPWRKQNVRRKYCTGRKKGSVTSEHDDSF